MSVSVLISYMMIMYVSLTTDIIHDVYHLWHQSWYPDSCPDNYTYVEDICHVPTDHLSRDLGAVTLSNTTRNTCKHLCSGMYNDTCSSVLYNSLDLSCLLSAYTGYYHTGTAPDCLESEFFSRQRCIGELSFKVTNLVVIMDMGWSQGTSLDDQCSCLTTWELDLQVANGMEHGSLYSLYQCDGLWPLNISLCPYIHIL